jgi:hypothetical protein
VLATISFTLSFAAWGLIGGLASGVRSPLRAERVADSAGRDSRPPGLTGAPADGHDHRSVVIWPAAGASAFCLLLNAGLLRYLYVIDRVR